MSFQGSRATDLALPPSTSDSDLDETNAAEQLASQPPSASIRWHFRVRRITFMDLDDTLVPTTWMRNRFADIRCNRNPHNDFARFLAAAASNETHPPEILPYMQIRQYLDIAGQTDFEAELCTFIRAVQRSSDRSLIVTNARSLGWLTLTQMMFPRFATLLRRNSITILKTSPETKNAVKACFDPKASIKEPNMDKDPKGYFEYWMSAKLVEFRRVLESELRMAASMGISLCLELCNVGDNDFEHVAFHEVVKITSCVSLARNIRCTQGLHPKDFVQQLRRMTNLVDNWFVMDTHAQHAASEESLKGQVEAIAQGHALLPSSRSTFPLPMLTNTPANMRRLLQPRENERVKLGKFISVDVWKPDAFVGWARSATSLHRPYRGLEKEETSRANTPRKDAGVRILRPTQNPRRNLISLFRRHKTTKFASTVQSIASRVQPLGN